MLVIGLTGGIGSGKSAVADLFRKLKVAVIDADQIARELVAPGSPLLAQIAQHFGDKALTKTGDLDRRYLRQVIFMDKKKKVWLENLMHPLIIEQIKQKISQVQSSYCVVVIPLLVESAYLLPFISRILVIDTPVEQQIERAIQRDKLSFDEAKAIVNQQVNRTERLLSAHDIIENKESLNELEQKIHALHEKYINLANQT